MISFNEAIDLVRSVAKPLGEETVSISDAAGRVLAAPVVARIDSPRTHVSAMDGYAVRDADFDRLPAILQQIGASFAGSRWEGSVAPGTCVRIFTGAPVPSGADRVVIQENVRFSGDRAVIDDRPGSVRYIRKRASDFAAGDELLAVGRLLDARAIVAAAAADVAELKVHRRPRLTILSTGDELAEPGSAAGRSDAVPESVSFGVRALASQWGGDWAGRMRLCDDLSAMHEAAAAALGQSDLVVVTGGASVGERDFAKAMFEPFGLELLFSRLSIRPGKPAWLGSACGGFVIGLPGNPTSALVTARLLLVPLLAGMTGQPIERALAWRTLPLATPIGACDVRETFHRARSVHGTARVLSFQESSAQKVLADADLLVRQRANAGPIATGELVETLDF